MPDDLVVGGVEFVDPVKFSQLFKDGRSNMSNIAEMLTERASIELRYSNSLCEWEQKHRRKLEQNKLTRHQDTYYALKYVIDEGVQVAKAHKARRNRLMDAGGPVSLLKRWHSHGYGFHENTEATVSTLDTELNEYRKCVHDFLNVVKNCRKSKQEHENLTQEMTVLRNKFDDKLSRHKADLTYKDKLVKKEAELMSLQCRVDTAKSKYEAWTNKLKSAQPEFVKDSKKRSKCLIKQEEKRLAFLTDRLIQHLDNISLKNRSIPDGSDLQGVRKHLVGLQHDRQTRTWAHGSMNFIKCSDLKIVKSKDGHVGSSMLPSPPHPLPSASVSAEDTPTTPLVGKYEHPGHEHSRLRPIAPPPQKPKEEEPAQANESSESDWDSDSSSEYPSPNHQGQMTSKRAKLPEQTPSLYPNMSPDSLSPEAAALEEAESGGLLHHMVGDGNDGTGVFSWANEDDSIARSSQRNGSDDDDLSVIELENMPMTPTEESLAKGGTRPKYPRHQGHVMPMRDNLSTTTVQLWQDSGRKYQLPAPTTEPNSPAQGRFQGDESSSNNLTPRSSVYHHNSSSSGSEEDSTMNKPIKKIKKSYKPGRMLRPLKKVFSKKNKNKHDENYMDITPLRGYEDSNCVITERGIQFGEMEVLDPNKLQALSD